MGTELDGPAGRGLRLALFDLDGTLIPHDSDHAFNEFVIALGWADAATFKARNDAFYADYLAQRLDLPAYIEFATSPWRGRAPHELAAAQQRFMDEVLGPSIGDDARALVERHRAAGDELLMVTATNAFVTAPVARAFGIDTLIAVDLARDDDGRVTGAIKGTPSFREGKVARLHQWLQQRGLAWDDIEHAVFYSDSLNDLPLLELVHEPVATNPSPPLQALARSRGWRELWLYEPST